MRDKLQKTIQASLEFGIGTITNFRTISFCIYFILAFYYMLLFPLAFSVKTILLVTKTPHFYEGWEKRL